MPGIQNSQIFLQSWIHQENRIITCKLMSRACNIHVDQAKRQMQVYYEANQEKTGATFVIRGQQATRSKRKQMEEMGDGDETMVGASQDETQPTQTKYDLMASHVPTEMITLVDGDKLESAKSAFSNILSVQIYSLQPGAIKVASTSAGIVSTHADLHTNPEYSKTWEKADRGTKLGAFRNSQVQDLLSGNVKDKLLANAKDARPAAGSSTEVAAKQAKSNAMAPEAGNTSVSEQVPAKSDSAMTKTPASASAAKKGTLDFSNPTVKAAAAPAAAKKQPAKKKEKEKKKKTGNAALMSTSEEDEEDEEEEEPDADDAGPIGYDSDQEMADASGPARGKRADAADLPSSKKTAAQREKDRKSLMALADSSADEEEENPQKQQKKKQPDVKAKGKPSTDMIKGSAGASAKQADVSEKKKVRKQRKVIKKVKTKEKGYTVMRDVEEYESYSSFLSDSDDDPVDIRAEPKAAKKTSAAPAKAAAAAAASKPASTAQPAAPASKPPPKPVPAASSGPKPNSSTVNKSSSSSGPQRSGSGGGTAKPAAKGQQTLSGFFRKK